MTATMTGIGDDAGDDVVRARQGDTVDALIWRERNFTAADLAAVLAINPGLADRGTVLPIGTAVRLPRVRTTTLTIPLIKLWD